MAKYVLMTQVEFHAKESEYRKHYEIAETRPDTRQYILRRKPNSEPPAKVSIDIETTTGNKPALVIYDELAPVEKELYDRIRDESKQDMDKMFKPFPSSKMKYSYGQWKTDKPVDESKYKALEELIKSFDTVYTTSYDEETTPEPPAEPEYPDGWYEVTIVRSYYDKSRLQYVITFETGDGLQGVIYNIYPEGQFPKFDGNLHLQNVGLQGKVYLRNTLDENHRPCIKFSLTDK